MLYYNHQQAETVACFHGARPVDTARLILKRLMSKQLAITFSLTGLGAKRAKVKFSFKEHPISGIVIGEFYF